MSAWWASLTALEELFALIAIPSAAVLVIQTALLVIGLRGAGDFAGDAPDMDGGFGAGGPDMDGDFTADAPELGGQLSGGFAGDGDFIPGDHPDLPLATADTAAFAAGLRIFTVRGLITFFTIFGWSGLSMLRNGIQPALSIILAFLLGVIAMVITALITRSFLRLQSDGTIDIRNAIGQSGSVYLTVPAGRQGKGKVNVVVQERLSEFEAVTDAAEPIRTSAEVVVVGVSGKSTLIVQPK